MEPAAVQAQAQTIVTFADLLKLHPTTTPLAMRSFRLNAGKLLGCLNEMEISDPVSNPPDISLGLNLSSRLHSSSAGPLPAE